MCYLEPHIGIENYALLGQQQQCVVTMPKWQLGQQQQCVVTMPEWQLGQQQQRVVTMPEWQDISCKNCKYIVWICAGEIFFIPLSFGYNTSTQVDHTLILRQQASISCYSQIWLLYKYERKTLKTSFYFQVNNYLKHVQKSGDFSRLF